MAVYVWYGYVSICVGMATYLCRYGYLYVFVGMAM